MKDSFLQNIHVYKRAYVTMDCCQQVVLFVEFLLEIGYILECKKNMNSGLRSNDYSQSIIKSRNKKNEPRSEKTGPRGFRPGPT